MGIFEDFVLFQELLCLELQIRAMCIRTLRTEQSEITEKEALYSIQSSKNYLKSTSLEEMRENVNNQLEWTLKERIWRQKDSSKKDNKSRLGLHIIPKDHLL